VARRPGDAAGEPKVPGPALPLLAPDPKGGQHEPRLIALLCAATARWCQLVAAAFTLPSCSASA
jgi:hypothetical protein